VKGILGDADIKGQMRILELIQRNADWQELWGHLGLAVFTFKDFQLADSATDAVVWHACQRNGVVLITGNRNRLGPTSLEETIQLHNRHDSLPVLTLSNPNRVKRSRGYADRIVESLLQYLLDMDLYRGAGRLYLP
jgi:hypothetical protein